MFCLISHLQPYWSIHFSCLCALALIKLKVESDPSVLYACPMLPFLEEGLALIPAVITSFSKRRKLRWKDSMGTFLKLVLSVVIQLSLCPVFLCLVPYRHRHPLTSGHILIAEQGAVHRVKYESGWFRVAEYRR